MRAIVGIGVDVVDIGRFAAQLERVPALAHRLFTETERDLPTASLAARFAAKEAFAKALGAPPGLSWQDAWVIRDQQRRPSFEYTGTVAARCRELGVTRVYLSLTHDGGIATAFVICEGSEAPERTDVS
jgi:holo-[acyl-carrier protein] synthase